MAENYIPKRQDMAIKAVDAATDIVRGVWALQNMAPDLAQSGGGFDDADFAGITALSHVNAWKMNNLVNVVSAALSGAADGALPGSQVTFKDILLAVKRA